MGKTSMWKRIFLLVVLVGAMAFSTAVAFAQEGEATPAAEGEVAAEEGAVEEAAGGSPLTPLGINTGFLLAQIINFGIIFLLLAFGLWRPMTNMLDNRAATIQKGLEDAAAAANARRNAEAEADQIKANARAEVARILEDARQRGESMLKEETGRAGADAERIRTEARTAGEAERNQQLGEMRSQVAAIGIAVAERLIGESIDKKRQQALINDFFAKVPADARSMGGDVEVVSAMPLTADEESRVRSEVGAQNVTFRVDPSILGGLIIRSADRVVDGSVRSSLTDLSSRIR